MVMRTVHTEEMKAFVDAVRQRAELADYDEAQQLCRACLEVLGESISGGEAGKLAQWLPDDLSGQLGTQTGHASRFDKLGFLDKIGGKVHSVDRERVERQVAAVLNTIRASAPREELGDTIAQLPPELAAMFDPEHVVRGVSGDTGSG